MKRFLHPLLPVSLLILLSSCDEDLGSGHTTGKSFNNLSFSVNAVTHSLDTRSTTEQALPQVLSTRIIPLASDDNEDDLCLVETVTSLDGNITTTRGVPIYSEGMNSDNSTYQGNFTSLRTQFSARIYGQETTGDQATQINQDDSYVYDDTWFSTGNCTYTKTDGGNTYECSFGKDVYWPKNNKQLMFFFESPQINNDTKKLYPEGKMSFSYTNSATPNTVDDQLVTIIGLNQKGYEEKNEHIIIFEHTLTAVKFNSGSDNTTKITAVEMNGLKRSGTCTVNPTSSSQVTWDNYSDQTMNATVTFPQQETEDRSDNSTIFPSTFNANTDSAIDPTAQLQNTAMVMPQTGSVTIIVHYTINGGSQKTRTTTIDVDWKAGHLYTYTLTVNEVNVKVETTNNYSFTATNNGNVSQYQRLSVSLGWYDTNGNLVIPIDLSTLNSIQASGNTTWTIKKAEDGYYYYPNSVTAASCTTIDLSDFCSTCTLPDTAPEDNLTLRCSIAVQAVKADVQSAMEAWGISPSAN